ncbi:MAG: FAD-dependent oxidoreductase [Planctomycetota bacterium]|nr:FAD-dependent oxidoreductase [Planctomycetota bacterium]
MKIVIVGGVAGGASAATRARRLNEDCEIVLLERGEEPSFANCGMPYYVGGEIKSRNSLLVAPIERLRQRYRLDVRNRTEVVEIDRASKSVSVRNLLTGERYTESYDKLIIATGASPFRPSIPGIESSRILELRDLKDADNMHALATSNAKHAVVIGAGFIGMEVAENLVRRDINVTVVQISKQILPTWDHEMVTSIEDHVRQKGVTLRLNDSPERFEEINQGNQIAVHLVSGNRIEADFVVISIGVRPESKLAAEAGISCGPRGGLITSPSMQTSDPDVYAVGDVVEVKDFVSDKPTQIPLAGPANRQGRIAADHIFGRHSSYRGTQGTAIVGVFGMTAAMTGQSESQLKKAATPYEKIYIHPNDHAGYYPGAKSMTLKLLFDPEKGRILGAQGVGSSGVDKRIDVIAMAIQAGLTVYDLEQAELCYAPQYGSAKDPINMAGFVASSVLRGDHPVIHADCIMADSDSKYFILDVRTESEFNDGRIPKAINIPLDELRTRLEELPKSQKIAAYCKVGQRGYMATRILALRGFDVCNISGGYTSWCQRYPLDLAKVE